MIHHERSHPVPLFFTMKTPMLFYMKVSVIVGPRVRKPVGG
jgi:hypothetical protein